VEYCVIAFDPVPAVEEMTCTVMVKSAGFGLVEAAMTAVGSRSRRARASFFMG
jgi:hypothetical protein